MKAVVVLSAAILVAGCIQGGRHEAGARARTQAIEDEGRLAAALTGRTAGPPRDCVDERELGSHESYGKDAILFRGRTDDVVYVNRPPAGCPGLAFGQALKVRTPAARLCRGDIVMVVEPVSGMETGGCSLGEFTPYRRAPLPEIR